MTRSVRSWSFALFACVVALALAACEGAETRPTSRVFTQRAWTGPERLVYDLRQRTDTYGSCTLTTTPDAEPGKTRIERACADLTLRFRDDGSALVDNTTLLPASSRRSIVDGEKRKETVFSAVYEAEQVRFTVTRDGTKRNETTRDLPIPDEKSPEPGFYDDESLLWLVRGIPLEEGFSGAYRHVHAANGRVYTVQLKVVERTIINVPAGEFTTWEVEIRTSSITNRAWVEVAAPHRVIRARFEEINYELKRAE